MRKVIYSAACSFDGYIAGPDEAVDWLVMNKDTGAILSDLWAGVDTILMGRKTYEFATRGGAGGGSASTKTYVFSRTMTAPAKGATLVGEDAAAFVRALKAQEGGTLFVMGGGELATSLLEGRVVDEMSFVLHPLLLGGGTRLFQPLAERVELHLLEARALAGGCLFVRYAVP